VDADNRESLFLVFVIPIPQLRNDIFTVDSTIGPKFDQDNTTSQVTDTERFAVEPRPTGNVRRSLSD
jgi:hypothetical protein